MSEQLTPQNADDGELNTDELEDVAGGEGDVIIVNQSHCIVEPK